MIVGGSPRTSTPTELLSPPKIPQKNSAGARPKQSYRLDYLLICLELAPFRLFLGRLPWFHRACLSTTLDKIFIARYILTQKTKKVKSVFCQLLKKSTSFQPKNATTP